MDTAAVPMNHYLPRAVDETIDSYLRIFGAVEITGTKWCGKTWSALRHAKTVNYVDQSLELAKADPSLMLLGERPHLIDEWQLVPSIWDSVRHQVDADFGAHGSFLLTGSSTPLDPEVVSALHSGAGRIGKIRMRPMSLQESGDSKGVVSLKGLFAGEFTPAVTETDTLGLVDLACRGGWPGVLGMAVSDAQTMVRDYAVRSVDTGAARAGLDVDVFRRVLVSLARNLGQSTTYKVILRDMFGAEEHPENLMGEDKVRTYLEAMKSMFLIEEVPGWAPAARSTKRFLTKPKRYLADPSIAVALLGMNQKALLADWQTFGLVFENLVVRDLMVYASTLDLLDGTPVRYYHDDSGLEADAIIQLADGRWAAFEVKCSEDKVPQAVAQLKRLKAKVCENPHSQNAAPAFMAVITGNGQYARRVEDGIYVIPIRLLGK